MSDDVIPTEREFKEWCLALNRQNKQLWQSNLRKDTIIANQNTLLISKDKRISSYERDSITHAENSRAYEERLLVHESIHKEDRKIIRKLRTEKTLGSITAGLLISLLGLALIQ